MAAEGTADLLFQRCLMKVLHIDLWKCYLSYVRETKGKLPTYKEIWARFLAFESNIGDLASILKVERRRFTAFKEEYEGKETALLVDRYKFMDLYPCSSSELKALGYKVCTLQT
ncbi:UNVERIFIED_CONTAM: hypothetical protein FKN15_037551 [Acipenser sinensis]